MSFGEAVQHVLAADDRRRPRRADPGAADLDGDRHHRHPLGAPRPTSAPTSSGQILRQRKAPLVAGARHRVDGARPGPAEAPVPRSIGGIFFARSAAAMKAARAERDARRPPRRRPTPAAGAAAARRRARRARDRPARAGDRLRPRAARRPAAPAAALLRARRRRPPPDRGRARHRHPAGAHPRRRRRSTRTSTSCRCAAPRSPAARIMPGHQLAMNPGDARAGRSPASPTTEPAFGLPAVWIADGARAEAEALGYTVVDAESVDRHPPHRDDPRATPTSCSRARRRRQLLDALKEQNAAVVEEVVPDLLGVGEVQRVLQTLLREGVSIRDLGTILEAIGDQARDHARPGAAGRVRAPGARPHDHVRATSDDDEDAARDLARPVARAGDRRVAHADAPTASTWRWSRPARQALVEVARGPGRAARTRQGVRPVLVCSSRVRRHLRRLVEQALPQLPVVLVQRDRARASASRRPGW